MSGPTRSTPRGASLWRRTLETMMIARERQARRAVADHLLWLGDDELARLGHDRATLEQERRTLR